MPFGQKAGSLKNLKKNLSRSSSGGAGFIKFIPKNGALNVRFITEPEGWLSYADHYDEVGSRSFPCTTEADCPGCQADMRKSNRYLANVVNLDNNDRITALQLPVSLANSLVVKYEKWGSLTSRDMELSRQGTGLDTRYDLDWSPEDRKRVDRYEPLDLENVLQSAYNDYFGEGGGYEDEEEPKPAKKVAKKSAPRKKAAAAPPPADTTLDDDEDEKPAPRKRSRVAPKKASEPQFEPDEDEDEDDEPDEPEESEEEPEEDEEAEEEDDGADDEGYTVEELQAMTLGQLRKVARDEFGVNVRGLTQADILDAILEAGEEED